MTTGITTLFARAKEAWSRGLEKLQDRWDVFWNTIKSSVWWAQLKEDIGKKVEDIFTKIKQKLAEGADIARKKIKEAQTSWVEDIKPKIEEGFQAAIDFLVYRLPEAAAVGLGWLVGTAQRIWDWLNETLSKAWDKITEGAQNLWKEVKKWLGKVWDDFVTWLGKLPGKTETTVNKAADKWDWSFLWDKLFTWLSTTWANFTAWLGKLPDMVATWVSRVLKKWTWEKLRSQLASGFKSALAYLNTVPGTVMSILNRILSFVISWAQRMRRAFEYGMSFGKRGALPSLPSPGGGKKEKEPAPGGAPKVPTSFMPLVPQVETAATGAGLIRFVDLSARSTSVFVNFRDDRLKNLIDVRVLETTDVIAREATYTERSS